MKHSNIEDITDGDGYMDGDIDDVSEQEEESELPALVLNNLVNPCKVCFSAITGQKWSLLQCGHTQGMYASTTYIPYVQGRDT